MFRTLLVALVASVILTSSVLAGGGGKGTGTVRVTSAGPGTFIAFVDPTQANLQAVIAEFNNPAATPASIAAKVAANNGKTFDGPPGTVQTFTNVKAGQRTLIVFESQEDPIMPPLTFNSGFMTKAVTAGATTDFTVTPAGNVAGSITIASSEPPAALERETMLAGLGASVLIGLGAVGLLFARRKE